MVWLCTEHQKQDGVAILSDEVADVNTTSQEAGIDVNSAFKDLVSSASTAKDGTITSIDSPYATGLLSYLSCLSVTLVYCGLTD